MRPKSIVLFERAFLASIALGVVGMLFTWSAAMAQLEDPALQAVGLGQGFLVGTLVVTVALSFLLWFFVARRASRIAKWIFVVLVAFGTLSTAASLANPVGLSTVFGLVNTTLQVFAAWQLFKPDAVAWLASGGREATVDPTTFD